MLAGVRFMAIGLARENCDERDGISVAEASSAIGLLMPSGIMSEERRA